MTTKQLFRFTLIFNGVLLLFIIIPNYLFQQSLKKSAETLSEISSELNTIEQQSSQNGVLIDSLMKSVHEPDTVQAQ